MAIECISIDGASAILKKLDLVDGASEILNKLVVVVGKEIRLDLKRKKKKKISLDLIKKKKKITPDRGGVEDELRRLKQTLELIAAKTSDAERKQVNDVEVSLWLKKLKEAAHDADDVLDEFSYKVKKDKVTKKKISSNQVSFLLKKAHKIKNITQLLNQIAIDMERFQFTTMGGPYKQHKKKIKELINYLQVLVIRNLEKVRGIEDAERAELKDKQNVQLLELHWDGEGIHDSTMVLESLQPHPNLKTLLINGFQGFKLPKWMGGFDSTSTCLPNLVELKLQNCNSCEQLPSLGLLPCLRVLHMDGMNSVKCLGEEFYCQKSQVREEEEEEVEKIEEEIVEMNTRKLQPSTSVSSTPTSFTISMFRSLIELSLGDMSSLEAWLPPPPNSYNSFPSLQRLIISGCFQLRSIPLSSFSSLDSLELSNTSDKVISSIMEIKGARPRYLSTSLLVQDSPRLKLFPVWVLQHFKHLQSLEISCCSELQGFCIQNYNNSNENVKSSYIVLNYTSISSLYSLKLRNCPSFTYLPDLQEWKSLTELWIENCDKLKKSLSNYDLTSLPGLRTLYVDRFIHLKDSFVRPASTTTITRSHAIQRKENIASKKDSPVSAVGDAAIEVSIDTLAKLLIEEIYFLREVKDELELLLRELKWMVTSFLEADKAAKSDSRLEVWVKQLREIIYEAEDVVDEFNIKIMYQKRMQNKSKAPTPYFKSLFTSTKQLLFLDDIGKRIEKINERADNLKQNKDYYGSVIADITNNGTESPDRGLTLHQKIQRRRAEIFKEEHQDDNANIHEAVVGQIMPLLMTDEGALHVISILGMGGVGKTTLCKKLYNLSNGFDCRACIYISKTYNLDNLLKSILKQCFGPMADESLEFSNKMLYDRLKEKKYFIVLDDVWDTSAWFSFEDWFPDNNKGSIVLLTTRHKSVANLATCLSGTDIHKLDVLNETESWQIFLNRVRPEPGLENLGKEMVKKCGGLPLAIVVLGDLLKEQNMQENAWSAVNASARWLSSEREDSYKCIGILALSYNYMPYYLKQCFLYMSLFPQESNIAVAKLCQYWIAEGFVSKRGEETLEDIAEDYLEELIGRSLIQVSKRTCDGRVKTCHIHGLLHRISASESQADEFSQIYGSIDEFCQKQNRSRRVAVYCKHDEWNEPLSIFHDTRLRSLMCRDVLFAESNYLCSLFGAFKSLRVLEFYGDNKGLVSLPKEVGELIHLRYLSLENTKLESIDTIYLSELVSLQTLNLKGCISEITLDCKFWSLHQLRHLYLDGIRTTENNSWPQVASTGDNLGIGDLTNLQLLHIQAGDWIYNGGLKRLSSLRKLRIEECLNSHCKEISDAVVNLTGLRSVALTTSKGVPLPSIQFSSHTSLRRLHLRGYINGWRHISFPPNLCKLKLEWSWITEDPTLILEKLPSLTFLHLGFDSYLGEKLVCSREGFSRLQTLEIVSLENLEEWIIEEGALKSLANLEICNCERLEMIPDGIQQMSTLKSLRVVNMPLPFQSRMAKEVGKDWNKIKHVPANGLDISGF